MNRLRMQIWVMCLCVTILSALIVDYEPFSGAIFALVAWVLFWLALTCGRLWAIDVN